MIFDFDVHHGNGTNDVFDDDADVLFVSTHQQGSYPGTGKLADTGCGNGEGTSINLPLPGRRSTLMFRMHGTASESLHARTACRRAWTSQQVILEGIGVGSDIIGEESI